MKPIRLTFTLLLAMALAGHSTARADSNNQAYVGGPTQYQIYKQLGLENKLANDNLEAAEMNQDASMEWGAWGGWGAMGGIGRR